MRPARKPLLYPAIYFLICPEYREMLRKEAPPDIYGMEEFYEEVVGASGRTRTCDPDSELLGNK